MQPYQFTDSRQSLIYQRLNTLVGPGAATFYKDACRLMEMEPPLESTTNLVGHLLREIESSLRDILMTLVEEPIPKKKKSNGNIHKEEIQTILKILEFSETSATGTSWLQLPGNDRQYGLHKRAHRNDLAPPRAITEEFENFWNRMNALFDTVLDRLETKSSKIRMKLDELLAKSQPTDKDIKFLKGETPNSRLGIGYFFDRLEFSAWLKPLHEADFFKHPPGQIFDSEGRASGFPSWAQTKYLIKVASDEPATVLDIAIQIFDTGTENIRVYEDLAQAALKMPSEFAARWAERAMIWIQKQTYLDYLLLETLGQLINYLASENQEEKSINLVQELLTFLIQSDSYLQRISRLDDLYYNRTINFHMLKLRELQPAKVLTLFCTLLDRYLSLSYPYFIEEEKFSRDQSYDWLPNLESEASSLDGRNSVARILARAILAITKQIIEQDSSKIEILFRQFQGYRWQIFDRISLQLLRQFPMHLPNFIINRLTDRNRFECLALSSNIMRVYDCHEHAMLLKEQFSNLPDNARKQIFDWLLEDPIDAIKIGIEYRESHIKYWRRDWFSIIEHYLPSPLKQVYDQLVKELGEPKTLASFFDKATNRELPYLQSPRSGAELTQIAKIDINELFIFLQQWKPSGNLLEPSREDLARELADHVIALEPQLFISQIERFKELDPKFMIALIRGLKKAVINPPNEHFTFLWEPVLSFCQWMRENLKHIKEQPSSDSYSEWSWICDAVVDLVDSGLLSKGSNIIPLSLRRQVWQLLEPIITDIYVTSSFSLHDQNNNSKLHESSINTVRRSAMNAVIKYAYWIRQDTNAIEEASQNFDDMPEVRRVLEWHLNPQQDPAPDIHAAYGEWLPDLLHLASDWTTQRITQIFPEEPASKELWMAAWEGYLSNNQLYSDVFKILRRQYICAVELLTDPYFFSHNQLNINEALSLHLPNLFCNKLINLGESDQLLEIFFIKAPNHHREQFMRELSWLLLYDKVDVDDHLRLRLQTFLKWRIDQLNNSTNAEDFSDLKYFSWIFASGKFEDQWSITQLITVLEKLKEIEQCEAFLTRLENLASAMPQETVQCLDLLAKGSKAVNWFSPHYSYSQHLRTIFQVVLKSENEVAKKDAKELINRLIPRYLTDWRDLLKSDDVVLRSDD